MVKTDNMISGLEYWRRKQRPRQASGRHASGSPAALRSRVYAEHPPRVRVGKHLAGSVYGPV